jgi:hypothetical protein
MLTLTVHVIHFCIYLSLIVDICAHIVHAFFLLQKNAGVECARRRGRSTTASSGPTTYDVPKTGAHAQNTEFIWNGR